MSFPTVGAIDCDVHPTVPGMRALMPYIEEHWREQVVVRGIDGLDPASYPVNIPANGRPDWRPASGKPGSDLGQLREHVLAPFHTRYAILNCRYGAQSAFNVHFAAALCRAINEWQYAEWTQKDQRRKAAIVVPGEDAAAAVAEIEHWAGNPDFSQVSLVTHSIEPLGRRRYRPIHEAAMAHNLPIGLHSSGNNGHAVTPTGWPSYYTEEHHEVSMSQQALVTSMVCEGVLARCPALKVVIVDAGLAWVPSLC